MYTVVTILDDSDEFAGRWGPGGLGRGDGMSAERSVACCRCGNNECGRGCVSFPVGIYLVCS